MGVYYLRQLAQDGIVAVQHINTTEMVADGLTKALNSEKISYLADKMGIRRSDESKEKRKDSANDIDEKATYMDQVTFFT